MKVRLVIPSGKQGLLFCHVNRGTQWQGPPHQHRELELNIGLTGHAWILVRNKRVPLFEHGILWLYPEHEHMIIEKSDDFSMIVAVFRSNLVQTARNGRGKSPTPRPVSLPRRLSRNNFETLEKIWTPLLKAAPSAYFNAGLSWLYYESNRCYDEENEHVLSGEVHPSVERAALWLRNHPETDDLEQLAWRVGVSSPWLSRLFKKQMGISMAHFRNEQRLQQFRSRYGEGSRYTLTEAAFASGFNTYTQFFRAYRRAFGRSPSKSAV